MALPQKFSDYQNDFTDNFVSNEEVYEHDCRGLNFAKVTAQLEKKVEEKLIKKYQVNKREKFSLSDMTNSNLNNPRQKQILFLTNILNHEPIYFFVSKIKNWFRFSGAGERQILEVSIAMTEAFENAVKYSNASPIIVNHSLIDQTYDFFISNSVEGIDEGANAEELKKKDSLMRGVLIMSKILNDFSLDRDNSKNIVTLCGKICIS